MPIRGLRFPSPVKSLSQTSLRNYLREPASKIHNAFPELVDLSAPATRLRAWSNPLIQLWYHPTLDPAPSYERERLEQGSVEYVRASLSHFHEQAHLYYQYTPAKDLCRLWLATAYTCIDNICLVR